MNKFLLVFFASSASAVVLFVATNFSSFSSHLATPFLANKSVVTVKLANLNIANPVLGLTNSHPHVLDANLGCNCPICIQFS